MTDISVIGLGDMGRDTPLMRNCQVENQFVPCNRILYTAGHDSRRQEEGAGEGFCKRNRFRCPIGP